VWQAGRGASFTEMTVRGTPPINSSLPAFIRFQIVFFAGPGAVLLDTVTGMTWAYTDQKGKRDTWELTPEAGLEELSIQRP